MNYDQLARGYDPRGRIEEGYAYNPAQQQEKYNPGAISGASIEKVRPQGNVTREVQQFEKHLNALICVIDELDRRLATATIPAPETNNSLRGSDQSGSALASQLSSFNNMLAHQISRLESIYQGIDL
jgi:hypothetical protein